MRVGLALLGGIAASTAAVLTAPALFPDYINSIGIIRFGRAAIVTGYIVADYKRSVYGKKLPCDPKLIEQIWSDVHRRSAETLLGLCRSNRGVFIKVGQHLAALDYLLPPEYIETLRILHSQAPSSTLEDVFKVIKEDLKIDNVNQVFQEFETEPLGAASLAQVYKAKLVTTNEIVAVKVQHREVRAHSYVDMKTMEVLVRIAAYVFPDFKLLWLVEETKKNLPKELDFLSEAENADQMSKLMCHHNWLRIPKIHWKYSSERVLLMEFCEGGQVNDLEYMCRNKISPIDVASKLGKLYSEMIFIHGYVHCDPHPGNILVHKTKEGKLELCLLDHGLYTTLTNEFRYNYSKLWLSILNSNIDGIKKYSDALGVGAFYGLFACMVTGRSWNSISGSGGIANKKSTADEEKEIRKSIGNYLPQISEILDRVPRPMILIFKTNDLLRGVEHALHTTKTMSSFTTMSKYCVKAVYFERLRKCKTRYCTFKNILCQRWVLFRINAFEIYVLIKSYFTYAIFS